MSQTKMSWCSIWYSRSSWTQGSDLSSSHNDPTMAVVAHLTGSEDQLNLKQTMELGNSVTESIFRRCKNIKHPWNMEHTTLQGHRTNEQRNFVQQNSLQYITITSECISLLETTIVTLCREPMLFCVPD